MRLVRWILGEIWSLILSECNDAVPAREETRHPGADPHVWVAMHYLYNLDQRDVRVHPPGVSCRTCSATLRFLG